MNRPPVYSERLDDTPFVIELAKRLKIAEVIHRHAGTHNRQRGLQNGQLAVVWLAYILSTSDHCKVGLEEWAARRTVMIGALLEQQVTRKDFCDDRLARLLDRLSPDDVWEAIEASLWSASLEVHDLPIDKIRVDATTCAGYHEMTENGLMQLGHSKQHRPDLPQLKIMAGAVEGFGHIVAADVVSGEKADDPLYTLLIRRIRKMIRKTGLLYTGDCKMASLSTRAELAEHHDLYLIPLSLTGTVPGELEKWITEAENGTQTLTVISAKTDEIVTEVARGYECKRELCCNELKWIERVLVVRSKSFSEARIKILTEKLGKVIGEIYNLTPKPGKGKRQIQDEEELRKAIAGLEKKGSVQGLLHVTWERQETPITKYKGKGRGGANRERITETKVRYVVTNVKRNEEAIAKAKYRLGWRAFVTNAKQEELSLQQAVLHYRNGYKSIERQFDVLRNRSLGLSPLFVKKDEQLVGLTRFLTIALRFLTLTEMVVQSELSSKQMCLKGFFRGQPVKATNNPTGQAILGGLARAEMSLYLISTGDREIVYCNTENLPSYLKKVFECMGISERIYEATFYESFIRGLREGTVV